MNKPLFNKIISMLFLLCIVTAANSQVRVTLRSDIGTYLSVCTGCQQVINNNSGTFNSATLHESSREVWYTHYYMQRLENGNYTFRNEHGGYLGICTGCIVNGTTSDFLTFHTTSPEPWAQFSVRKLGNGKYAIKSVHNGKYIARCQGCSPTASTPNTVTAHSTNPDNEAYAQWDIEIY